MVDSLSPAEALDQAIRSAGSQAALAKAIGVSTTAVWKMVTSAKRASVEFVLAIESATGVSRHALRPDIYPIEEPARDGPVQPPAEGAAGPSVGGIESDSALAGLQS